MELVGTDYLKKDLMASTEEAYLTQKGLFLDALRELKREEPGEAPPPPTSAPHPYDLASHSAAAILGSVRRVAVLPESLSLAYCQGFLNIASREASLSKIVREG